MSEMDLKPFNFTEDEWQSFWREPSFRRGIRADNETGSTIILDSEYKQQSYISFEQLLIIINSTTDI